MKTRSNPPIAIRAFRLAGWCLASAAIAFNPGCGNPDEGSIDLLAGQQQDAGAKAPPRSKGAAARGKTLEQPGSMPRNGKAP